MPRYVPHLVARNRLHSSIQVFREVGKQIAAFIGAPLPSGSSRPWPFRERSGLSRTLRSTTQKPAHLLAHAQTRPMKTNSHGTLLQIENPGNLLGGQLFHVMEYEDNTQRRRYAQDRLMQQLVLFGVEQIGLRDPFRHPGATVPTLHRSASTHLAKKYLRGHEKVFGACASSGFE